MHFNRTQFAATTQVRLFLVVILILVFLLTSCTGSEIDDVLADIEVSHWTIFPGDLLKAPILSIDSIRYDSVSTYRVCSSLMFDSTIVLTGFVFDYWENANEVNRIREVVVDTIDLRVEGPYVHKVMITKLKPNSEYQVRAMVSYLLGKDTTTIGVMPVSFKTD